MKYTEQDNQFIKDNFKNISSYTIAELLNRKQGSISRQIRKLGLKTFSTPQALMKQGKRRCSHCNTIKPLDSFYLLGSGRYGSKCKGCSISDAKEYHYSRYSTLENYASKIIKTINKRRKDSTLLPQDVINQFTKQDGKCFYTQENLALEANSLHTISIDRVNPDLPYQKDNVVLCCHIINLMKQSLQAGEFVNWCQKVVNVKPSKFPLVIHPE